MSNYNNKERNHYFFFGGGGGGVRGGGQGTCFQYLSHEYSYTSLDSYFCTKNYLVGTMELSRQDHLNDYPARQFMIK